MNYMNKPLFPLITPDSIIARQPLINRVEPKAYAIGPIPKKVMANFAKAVQRISLSVDANKHFNKVLKDYKKTIKEMKIK